MRSSANRSPGLWSESELNTIVTALNAALVSATGREWETGTTENGDAQFYLLGSLPDQACELCLSRIGRRYILEDGSGRLLFEHRNLDLVMLHARAAVRSDVVAYGSHDTRCGLRFGSAIHDKLEPMLAETEELLVQLAPQLAAFA